jgi:hypothetical protein
MRRTEGEGRGLEDLDVRSESAEDAGGFEGHQAGVGALSQAAVKHEQPQRSVVGGGESSSRVKLQIGDPVGFGRGRVPGRVEEAVGVCGHEVQAAS